VVVLGIASTATTVWYLATGGGRDAEAPIVAALRANAAPGDAVLWDVAQLDPFHRRPADLHGVPRSVTQEATLRRLDDEHVRWIVRSSLEPEGPFWNDALRVRLSPVIVVEPPALLQPGWTLTLYRVLSGPTR